MIRKQKTTVTVIQVSKILGMYIWHRAVTLLYCDCTSGWKSAHRTFAKNMTAPVIHKAWRLTNLTKKEPSLLRLFKIVRKLVGAYPIFNMAYRLMNIHLLKNPCPLRSFSASADDRLQNGKSSVNSSNCWSSLIWHNSVN